MNSILCIVLSNNNKHWQNATMSPQCTGEQLESHATPQQAPKRSTATNAET